MASRSSILLRRASETAPALTIVLLLVLPMALPNHVVYDARIVQRQAEIRERMDDLSFTISGMWVGRDVPVPVEARELLRPNAILSRHYQRLPDGPSMTVVFVHCSDLRDLRGHYPPNCYPNAGWLAAGPGGAQGRQISLELGGRTLDAQEYHYTRVLEHGGHAGLRVINFFILPDGTVTRRMDDIYRQAERLTASAEGACQVQIVYSPSTESETARYAAGELLRGMSPLLAALGLTEESNDAEE